MGAGAAKRVSAVRWGVAGSIVTAWVLTLPASAAIGGATYAVTSIFGIGLAGPLIVFIALVIVVAVVYARRVSRGRRSPRRRPEMRLLADPIVDWGELLT